MEAAAATRGVPLPTMMTPAQPSRKEWRIVSEQNARNNNDNEDLMRSKIGQSNERTTFEVHQGREPADVDFCSITIDGHSDGDILQQRFRKATRQREELQHMEIELRAQIIAREDIAEMQNSFDAHLKDQANSNVKLQEKVYEMEQTIHGLERKMEEKERELRAIKLDNEAAWAKEDLLIEQSNELKNFRREHDNTEAERTQHLKQIHELQEHLQDKERQFLELQEQNRVVHETILFKDEQLKDAQSWIARVQEMDVFQSHQSLQAEIRERTDQYNQLFLAYQQQFAEMERIHLHTIQQHQLEIADARDRAGFYSDETHLPKDSSQVGQSNGSQMNVNGSTKRTNSGALSNGNAESISSENLRNEVDHAHGIAIPPSSLVGMPTYLSPGQIAAFHPFLVHQQSLHSVPPHVAQSHYANFHTFPAASSLQHWPNQQVVTDASPADQEYPSSQNGHNILESDTIFKYDESVNGPAIGLVTLVDHSCEVPEHISVIKSSAEVQPVDKAHSVSPQPQQSIQHVPSQFDSSLRLNSLPGYEPKETEKTSYSASEPSAADCATSTTSEPLPLYEATRNLLSLDEMGMKATGAAVPSEVPLLDERSLLACIARTIPPGSGSTIRISSTLPNRLGKMLAPLHWHDYKKKYGKLEDFVSSHAELFVIEGDYIQVREGAKEIIAAAAAIAKVVAATNKTLLAPNSSPSVAVTPMSQSHRTTKRTPPPPPSIDTSTYGGYFNAGGVPKVKILSKPIDSRVMKATEISNPLSKGQQQAHVGRPQASFFIPTTYRTVGGATTFRK
ncbi:uncharacterized protein LOC124926248 isoform X2 [Impatiens glandulifera]|uniref:uncharacterized protein LOC124926248 isoform X2 n=1 Tax=Impatiens glandulifera TaxID=253017 RepID=UPI001FB058DF|nr:uncharacterized protein LOC124926248 isoform X2 [Impatiens glandulifera]